MMSRGGEHHVEGRVEGNGSQRSVGMVNGCGPVHGDDWIDCRIYLGHRIGQWAYGSGIDSDLRAGGSLHRRMYRSESEPSQGCDAVRRVQRIVEATGILVGESADYAAQRF